MGKLGRSGLVLLLLVVVTTGILFRFTHLGRKVYWHDEVFTSLRVAGYIGQSVGDSLFRGEQLTPPDLLAYQDFPPQAQFSDTLAALASHPEHPPLYYLTAYGWGRLFGASVAGYRGVAAVFGVLALPLMFWLGRALFPAQPRVAWIATGLMAVSPVQLIYSQEAREYSLWVGAMLLANLALLRAVQRGHRRDWLLYGGALALGLYSYMMTGLLMLAHGILVGLNQPPKRWAAFLGSVALSIGLFSPWLWVTWQNLQNMQEVTAWTQYSKPLDVLMRLWGLHYSAIFIDPSLPLDHPYTLIAPPLVIGLVVLASIHLIRHHPPLPRLLLLSLTWVPPLVLIGFDLLRTGQLTSNTRYFLPSLTVVLLLVAVTIADWIGSSQRAWRRRGWALLLMLLLAGTISCGVNLQAVSWWNKSLSYLNPWIAEVINQAEGRPLVVVYNHGVMLGESISISYWLEPDTTLLLTSQLDQLPLPPDDRAVFLFKPNQEGLERMGALYQLEPIPTRGGVELYRVRSADAALPQG